MTFEDCVDLFAGPGGWDIALRELGYDSIGIELYRDVVKTREAAGLRTFRGDVSALDPEKFWPGRLLIASPPCQAWSAAGKQEGKQDLEHVFEATRHYAEGSSDRYLHQGWKDPRSELVIEPIRWTVKLQPRWIALEQVPPVLDYWRFCADILRRWGYSVWTGILSAECYGVPQTRRRAILLANREGPVEPPAPTHQAYRPGEAAWPSPRLTLDGEILPWVSMAEALGWTGRVGFPRREEGEGEGYRDRDYRDTDRPAFGMTEKVRSWTREEVWLDRRQVSGAGIPVRPISKHEPAPTLGAAGLGKERDVWITNLEDSYSRIWGGPGPSPAERPATTVADSRVSSPNHHYEGEQNSNSIKISVQEAAVLQGFPPDYPFQGSKTQKFSQIGNAIPPPMARAILEALIR